MVIEGHPDLVHLLSGKRSADELKRELLDIIKRYNAQWELPQSSAEERKGTLWMHP